MFTRTIEETNEDGCAVATYKVLGFWTDRYISIYHHKERPWKKECVDISWAAGGRDYTEVLLDSDAAMNFAAALKDACEFAKSLEQRIRNGNEQKGA